MISKRVWKERRKRAVAISIAWLPSPNEKCSFTQPRNDRSGQGGGCKRRMILHDAHSDKWPGTPSSNPRWISASPGQHSWDASGRISYLRIAGMVGSAGVGREARQA